MAYLFGQNQIPKVSGVITGRKDRIATTMVWIEQVILQTPVSGRKQDLCY